MKLVDGEFALSENVETIAEKLYCNPKPKWYDVKFHDGLPVATVVQEFFGEYMFMKVKPGLITS